MVADWLWNGLVHDLLGVTQITDTQLLDFIDMGEWITVWLLVTVKLISLFGLIAIWLERKISAFMQSRLGPMRVGPKGLLQTLADGIKLLEKEDIIPKAADPFLFISAPCFVFASAVAMFVVLPFFNYEGRKDVALTDLSAAEVAFVNATSEEEVAELALLEGTEARVSWALSKSGATALERRKLKRRLENGEAIRNAANNDETAALLASLDYGDVDEAFADLTDPKNRQSVTRGAQGSALLASRHAKEPAADDHNGHTAAVAPPSGTASGMVNPALISVDSGAVGGPVAISADSLPGAPHGMPAGGAHATTGPPTLVELGHTYDQKWAPLSTIMVSGAWLDRPWFGTPAFLSAGLFFILAISSVSVMGVVLAGWGSNNKWALYGAIREAAQMVSYEIPMGIAALCVVVANQSLNLMDIAQVQETGAVWATGGDFHGGFLSWNLFKYPIVMIPVFIMWYIGVLAHTKRAPFDLPEAESELIAGFMTEYTGMRWSLFFLAEYGEMYALSALSAVLFLGGMASPIPVLDGVIKEQGPLAWAAWGAAWLMAKSVFLVLVMMWLRWTLPRIRLDQVMYLCLKVLLPFTMVALLIQTLWSLYIG
jgi:NADH-quinone oxidoreductase subunit H